MKSTTHCFALVGPADGPSITDDDGENAYLPSAALPTGVIVNPVP